MSSIHTPTRRQLLALAGTLPLALHAPFIHAAEKPLKLALLTSLTGVFSALGENMRAGLELYLKETGSRMGGRPVQLIVEDDHGKPDEALRKLHKLIARDKVDALCGIIPANIALAIRDVVTEAKLPTFVGVGAANELARSAASPAIFHVAKTSWMLGHPAALWTHEKIAQSGGITLASDYAAGREYVQDFIATFQEQGGSVSDTLWTPLGTSDFAPLITKMVAARPQFIYTFLPGADAVRFLKQMQDYGVQGKIPLMAPGALFDQEDVIPAAGDAALGGVNAFHQSPMAPGSADFAKAYRAARGRLPGESSTAGYAFGQLLQAAWDAVDGDASRHDAMREQLVGHTTQTAFGPMQFDARNNQAILDIYINEVRKGDDGAPLNTIVHTYERVRDPGPDAAKPA